jgi:glycosyltransferase involved in cell wall biosynthesis
MHVCHFCDSSLEGDYFQNIALGLTKRGVRVSLVELGPGSPPRWLPEIANVTYYSLEAAGKLNYPFAIGRLAQYLRDESVDILHTHLFFAGLIGVLAKRRAPDTIVALMRHHTSVVRMLGSRLHIGADKWMAQKADHVMTVSKAARDYMREVDGIKREVDVVYLGFDFERLAPNTKARARVRQEFGIADDEFVIGYVGNSATGKGHRQLVDAFEKILNDVPKARLFLAGRDITPDIAANPSNKIIFAGWRDDIPACLNAMDLFVQPSLSEAFSQVLIESMGAGLPVIATDVGGAREVIENGVNGILIEPNDPEAISREVVRLYKETETQLEMARKGMNSVQERFTAEQMVEHQMALYGKWMKEKHSA